MVQQRSNWEEKYICAGYFFLILIPVLLPIQEGESKPINHNQLVQILSNSLKCRCEVGICWQIFHIFSSYEWYLLIWSHFSIKSEGALQKIMSFYLCVTSGSLWRRASSVQEVQGLF